MAIRTKRKKNYSRSSFVSRVSFNRKQKYLFFTCHFCVQLEPAFSSLQYKKTHVNLFIRCWLAVAWYFVIFCLFFFSGLSSISCGFCALHDLFCDCSRWPTRQRMRFATAEICVIALYIGDHEICCSQINRKCTAIIKASRISKRLRFSQEIFKTSGQQQLQQQKKIPSFIALLRAYKTSSTTISIRRTVPFETYILIILFRSDITSSIVDCSCVFVFCCMDRAFRRSSTRSKCLLSAASFIVDDNDELHSKSSQTKPKHKQVKRMIK